MKFRLALLSFLIFTSCKGLNSNGTDANSSADPNTIAPLYLGKWLSDCVNMGNGLKNRVYQEIGADGSVKIAYLTYNATNCTGTYSLKDAQGSAVTAAQHEQNFSEESIDEIPDNFYVLKLTAVQNSSVQYVILYVNDHEFYELTGFTNPHTTWTQWQGEADVSQFAASPTTSVANTADKFHFTKSELP